MKGTIRQRLTVSVVVVTAVMLTLLVLGFNIALRSSLDGDANRLLEARAQAALESVDVKEGNLKVNEGSDEGAPDALVWIFEGRRVVEHPQASRKLDALAASLASKGSGTVGDESTDTRIHAVPVLNDGKQVGTVISAISLEPYERTADRAAIASVILGLIMIVLIALTTRLVVNRALKPVATMTAEAADWSEHDLDRRFNEGVPNDELTRLAATFDTMLDRMAYMVRHERNFSAELSHELRTPLAAIAAEAEIVLSRERQPGEYREALTRISDRSVELTRILETLLDVARSEGTSSTYETTDAASAIDAAIDASAPLAGQYGIDIRPRHAGDGLRVQVGPETFRRIFAPILENALAYGASSVQVSVTEEDRQVRVTVNDNGPGFSEGEAEAVFAPGERGGAARNSAAPVGTGLGLPLARRLARANGGDVTVDHAAPGSGGQVVISLPSALDHES